MKALFKTVKPKRVTEEIVEQMLELIAQGRLTPGERLPAERRMALSMGVSRPTLREALKRLEYAGLLRTVQGGGTYVLDAAGPSLRDPLASLVRESDGMVVELAEFRVTIEGWAARLAAERAEPDELRNLREILASMETCLAAGRPLHHLDAEFHLSLARATHNRIYVQVARTICDLYFEIARMSHEHIFPSMADQEVLFREHEGICRALERRDAKAAGERMHAHLSRTERWFRQHLEQPSRSRDHGHQA